MSYMKDLLENILEALERGLDYETIAKLYDVTPAMVYQVAKDYGDMD